MTNFLQRLSKFWAITIICCIPLASFSQDLASSRIYQEGENTKKKASELKPLRKVLTDLESKYKVSFAFEASIVGEKYVDIQDLASGELEATLEAVLTPLQLKYKKIQNNLYVIQSAPVGNEKLLNKIENKASSSASNEGYSSTNGNALMQRISLNMASLMSGRKLADVTITGRVISETNEGLPGVNVVIKGTSQGTTTDMNGDYSLTAPDGNGTLVFSYIGYTTQEVAIGGRSVVNVSLVPDVQALSEVVVIGYQTVNKRDLTGATAIINPAAANRVSTNSVVESLQGLAPGVTVRTGGAPGQMGRIEIRGAASFTNTDPLYVIDGMIADANTTINQNDIESIQVLKDASAAAIYGSRAANGVIIITTKQGKEGPARVSFSAKYGLQQIPKRWDLMNSSEFAAMQRMQYENTGQTPPTSVAGNPSVNTDWQDEVIRTGNLQDYNLSLSGGTQTGSYLISGSFFNNKGVLIGNSFERGSLRVNTRSTKGRVTFGENIVLTNSNVRGIPNTNVSDETNPFYNFPQMLPIIPVRANSYISNTNPEGWGIGTTDAVSYVSNPVAVNELSSRRDNFAKLVGNAYVDVKIFDWLTYRFNAGAEVSFDHRKDVREVGIWEFNGAPRASSIDEERSRFLSLLFDNTLNFNKTFGRHSINGVVGITQQHTTRETTSGGRSNLQIYNGEYYTTVGSGLGTSTAGGGRPDDYKLYGYLGRINYTFNDKYLLTLTGRIDQDSRFGRNYRTGYFPSIAAGWRISQEDFFNVGWISDLKLSGSYGRLGIVTLGSWDYTAFINNAPRAIFGPDQFPYVGSYQARLANPNLKWEERTVANVGIDASFFNNRLSVTLEGYNSLSDDNLLQLPVARYLGNLRGDPFINAGSIRNSGIDFSATYRSNTTNDFKWDVSANFTTIKNKVEDVGNQGEGINYIQSGNTRTQVGRSLGEWYLLETDGLFQSETEIESYTNAAGKVIQPNAKPGDVKYIDKNGDGTINNDDRNFVGSPWPKLQTGAQFNGSFRNFSLNIQLVGIFGFKIYNDVRRALDSYQQTNFRKDISPWSPTNTGTDDPRIALNTDQGIIDNNRANSERWLDNGSYVRIRNVELGYNLPVPFLTRANIQNARIYISGQNLFTFTGYKGLDPDVVGNPDPLNSQVRILERGVDLGNWPASRVFSLGIQCEF